MRVVARVLVVVLAGVVSAAVAEPAKQGGQTKILTPAAAEAIKVVPNIPAGNQQGQFPQGQGPGNAKLPPASQGAAGAAASINSLPVEEGSRPENMDAAKEAAELQEQLEAVAPGSMGLDFDQIDADEARRRGKGVDPESLGLMPDDKELDDAAAFLRGITERLGNNRDKQSDQTRSYGAGIVTDPQSLLNGAGSGLAGDEPNDGLGTITEKRTTDDGGTSTRYSRQDGSYTVVNCDQDGNEVSRSHHYRDGGGRPIVETHAGGVVSYAIQDGHEVRVESRPSRGGGYDYMIYLDGSVIGRSPHTDDDNGYNIAQDTLARIVIDSARDVDPDSAYGQGSGQIPGQKRKDPKMVDAYNKGVGPGARPDDQAAGGAVAARIQLDDFDDVVNPPPGEPAGGGSGPAHQGYDPNSTRDPGRDPR